MIISKYESRADALLLLRGEVNGHTLSMKLFTAEMNSGRTLRIKPVTAEMNSGRTLRIKPVKTEMSTSSSHPEKPAQQPTGDPVALGRNPSKDSLLDRFTLKKQELGALAALSVMPTEGLSETRFLKISGTDSRTLKKLKSLLLIQTDRQTAGEDGTAISLHPVIAEEVRRKYPPSLKVSRALMKGLAGEVQLTWMNGQKENAVWEPVIYAVLKSFDPPPAHFAREYEILITWLWLQEYFEDAKRYMKKLLHIVQRTYGDAHVLTGAMQLRMVAVCFNSRAMEEADIWYERAYETLKGLQTAKSGLISAVSVVTQTALTVLFIGAWRLPVWASALAAALNHLLISALIFLFLMRDEKASFENGADSFSLAICPVRNIRPEVWSHLLRGGFSKAAMKLLTGIGALPKQLVLNSFPVDRIAGYTVAMTISNIPQVILGAYGTCAAILWGKWHGGQRTDLLRAEAKRLFTHAAAMALVLTALIFIFASPLIRAVAGGDASKELIRSGCQVLTISSLGLTALAVYCVGHFGLQAIGKYRVQLVFGIISMLTQLVVLALAAPRMGFSSLPFTMMMSWIIPGIIAAIASGKALKI